jgi:hypothetical protein
MSTAEAYDKSVIKAADLAARLYACGEIGNLPIAAIKAASAYCVQREDVTAELAKRGGSASASKRSRKKRTEKILQDAWWQK